MAAKPPKTTLQPDTTAEPTNASVALSAAVDIENLIADELINDIDWQKVRSALIDRARQKFWVWLSSQILPDEICRIALSEGEAIALGASEVSDA